MFRHPTEKNVLSTRSSVFHLAELYPLICITTAIACMVRFYIQQ
jgi:hypothetical protein